MSAAYRLGFEPSLPVDRTTFNDKQWLLVGACPDTPMCTGEFCAADGDKVPYRLWSMTAPRALVLLLHGAFDYSGAFDEIGSKFARCRMIAFAIDQRGFGATSTRGRWCGKTRMIRDAIEAVNFLRSRYGHRLPVFIVGESMGAALAVHVAARAPDLGLAGLVLAAPGAVSGLGLRVLGSLVTRLLGVLAPDSGITIERLTADEYAPAAAIRLLSDPMVLRCIRPALLPGIFKLARSAVQEAGQVRVPVLTMVGTRDDILRISCIARLHKKLIGPKEWLCFKDGPHLLLQWKDGDRVIDKVLGWIGEWSSDMETASCESVTMPEFNSCARPSRPIEFP